MYWLSGNNRWRTFFCMVWYGMVWYSIVLCCADLKKPMLSRTKIEAYSFLPPLRMIVTKRNRWATNYRRDKLATPIMIAIPR
jgi:hypothetical protein